MKTVLISGGSGMIGMALTKRLKDNGYAVHHLSREKGDISGVEIFKWDTNRQEIDLNAFAGVSTIVHLAGAGIADKRWTDARKKELIDSRVETAALIYKGLKLSGQAIDTFVSASGINYHGSKTTEHIYVETDPPASSFIGECCVKWEAAADHFHTVGRVVKLRTGVVLAKDKGALKRIAAPVKLGFGAALGQGDQYVPYIHIDDLVNLYITAIENQEITGAYNASNGDHVTNETLTATLAKVLKKPYWMPNVPAFALKLAFGEMSEIVLEGSRASADKLKDTGFAFKHGDLEGALGELYS